MRSRMSCGWIPASAAGPPGIDAGHLGAACGRRQAAVGRDGDEGVIRAEPSAHDVTAGDDLVEHLLGRGAGDGEADPFGAGGLADQQRIDAHQLAGGVDQRAAGIAEVDRGVGLDEVLRAGAVELPPDRADDAHGHGLVEAQRIADGQHHVAGA